MYAHEARASLARHRWYDPLLGRWWQRDPAGYVDGMSLYEYVRSGPIGGWDPMGLEDVTAWEVAWQVPGALWGVVKDAGAGAKAAVKHPRGPLGAASEALGQRIAARELNVAAMEGREPNLSYGNLGLRGVQDMSGMHDLGAGLAGFDTTTMEHVEGLDRASKICTGAGQGLLTFAGGLEIAKLAWKPGLSAPRVGDTVYRVFGGESRGMGRSWTRTDPHSVANYRDAAGLPDGNTGQFVAKGRLTDVEGVQHRSALALDGNQGGLDEVVVPSPNSQIQLESVYGMNPPF